MPRGQETGNSHGDDLVQLDGDFSVGKDGMFTLTYPRHDLADRPAVKVFSKRFE